VRPGETQRKKYSSGWGEKDDKHDGTGGNRERQEQDSVAREGLNQTRLGNSTRGGLLAANVHREEETEKLDNPRRPPVLKR